MRWPTDAPTAEAGSWRENYMRRPNVAARSSYDDFGLRNRPQHPHAAHPWQHRREQVPDMVSIHVRPPKVNDRVMPGHWEGDFIKGAGNKSSAGVLVERTSRRELLARMEDATAASALAGFTVKLSSIAAPMGQSLTYDQGKEMSRHAALAANTGVRVYYCDPHSPWQRGPCEHTIGLQRQYLPKGTDLSITPSTSSTPSPTASTTGHAPRTTGRRLCTCLRRPWPTPINLQPDSK